MGQPKNSISVYPPRYLDNSKCIGEKTRGLVKEFLSRKKSGQVYWS